MFPIVPKQPATSHKVSLSQRGDISETQGDEKMFAARSEIIHPFHCKSPTLVSTQPQPVGLKMNLFSEDDEESLPGQDADNMDIEETRVSYTEISREITRSESETSEDGKLFLNSRAMGKHFQASGNYSQALKYYRIALQCKNRKIDSEPQSVQGAFADILFDIGNIHLVPGFMDRAKSLEAFHFCLDIRRMCFGSSHPAVANVLHKLASMYSSFDEHQYALDLLLESVSILLFASPGDKTSLIEVWTTMGKVQLALGQTDEADSSFQEAEQLK